MSGSTALLCSSMAPKRICGGEPLRDRGRVLLGIWGCARPRLKTFDGLEGVVGDEVQDTYVLEDESVENDSVDGEV